MGTTDIRVISGKFRGRILKSPSLSGTHPMGSREKLALFNMVSVEGKKVLDAYAGSGALGIEALSRGAERAVFVENDYRAARIIRENLELVGVKAEVRAEKVEKFAEGSQYQGYFDVIFADPPYDKVEMAELKKLSGLLASDGVMVVSSPAEMGEIAIAGMRASSNHTYARARLTILRKGED